MASEPANARLINMSGLPGRYDTPRQRRKKARINTDMKDRTNTISKRGIEADAALTQAPIPVKKNVAQMISRAPFRQKRRHKDSIDIKTSYKARCVKGKYN